MKFAVILFVLISLLSLNAKALAVASDYLEGNTLVLEEGKSAIYSIRLQNTESYEAVFKVDFDNRFLKLIEPKEQFIVAPKTSHRIEFNVTAPIYDHSNENNNLFTIGYTVHQLSGPSGGGIPFLTKINKNFRLKVSKKPSLFDINFYQLGYFGLLAIIAFVLLRKMSKARKMPQKKK
jgi:hypothetical protein